MGLTKYTPTSSLVTRTESSYITAIYDFLRLNSDIVTYYNISKNNNIITLTPKNNISMYLTLYFNASYQLCVDVVATANSSVTKTLYPTIGVDFDVDMPFWISCSESSIFLAIGQINQWFILTKAEELSTEITQDILLFFKANVSTTDTGFYYVVDGFTYGGFTGQNNAAIDNTDIVAVFPWDFRFNITCFSRVSDIYTYIWGGSSNLTGSGYYQIGEHKYINISPYYNPSQSGGPATSCWLYRTE